MNDDWRVQYADPICKENQEGRFYNIGVSLEQVLAHLGIPDGEVDYVPLAAHKGCWLGQPGSPECASDVRILGQNIIIAEAQKRKCVLVVGYTHVPVFVYSSGSTNPWYCIYESMATGIKPKTLHKGDV